jgi:RNA polymerase sigma factor (sigma-70 family)
LTQNEVIQGCKKGDERSYRYLVDAYADQLMGICVRYLRDHQKAEDALQETFIQVFRSIQKFDGAGSLAGWMYRIAVNCCLKELRKTRQLSFPEEETVFEQLIEWPEVYDKLNAEDIMNLLDALPQHYRIIFNLNIIEGYSHKEISELLGIQGSHSRTKLTRAKKMIQEIYLLHYKKSVV